MLVLVCVPAFSVRFSSPHSRKPSGSPIPASRTLGVAFSHISAARLPLRRRSPITRRLHNPNPVILDSAGRADVWLQAQAYTLVMYSAGGTNCSTGTLLWSENGVNSSVSSLLALNNVWTGTNSFNNTTTFNSVSIFNAGFTANGPANLLLGGQLSGSF